jgi:hypothetical protein
MSFGWELEDAGPDLPGTWATQRKKGKKPVVQLGELGTLSDAIGGDLVCAKVGEEHVWLEVAWISSSGMCTAHAYNPEIGRIDLASPWLKSFPPDTPCRFLGVRPK